MWILYEKDGVIDCYFAKEDPSNWIPNCRIIDRAYPEDLIFRNGDPIYNAFGFITEKQPASASR